MEGVCRHITLEKEELNIPDIVSASITSLAFIGGGISLYTTGVSRDAVIEERVEALLTVTEKTALGLSELSEEVVILRVKQASDHHSRKEVVDSLLDLTKEVQQLSKQIVSLEDK